MFRFMPFSWAHTRPNYSSGALLSRCSTLITVQCSALLQSSDNAPTSSSGYGTHATGLRDGLSVWRSTISRCCSTNVRRVFAPYDDHSNSKEQYGCALRIFSLRLACLRRTMCTWGNLLGQCIWATTLSLGRIVFLGITHSNTSYRANVDPIRSLCSPHDRRH